MNILLVRNEVFERIFCLKALSRMMCEMLKWLLVLLTLLICLHKSVLTFINRKCRNALRPLPGGRDHR